MLVLDLSLFYIFCNFHKKQKILVDNKIENEKNKNNKKRDKKRVKNAKDTRKITKKKSKSQLNQHRSINAGQRDDNNGDFSGSNIRV